MAVMVLLTHSGEADSDGGSFANMLKHLGFAVTGDVVSHLKVAKRPCNIWEKAVRQVSLVHKLIYY